MNDLEVIKHLLLNDPDFKISQPVRTKIEAKINNAEELAKIKNTTKPKNFFETITMPRFSWTEGSIRSAFEFSFKTRKNISSIFD
jgi:hypothetical protein